MDLVSGKMLAMGIAILAVAGPGIGLGLATKAMIESVARQPEADNKIMKLLVLGCALAEATAIYGFVVAVMILFT